MKKIKMKNLIWGLFVLVVVYNMLDVWHTYIIIESGIGHEANPLVSFFIDNFGYWPGISLLKGSFLLILGVSIHQYIKEA